MLRADSVSPTASGKPAFGPSSGRAFADAQRAPLSLCSTRAGVTPSAELPAARVEAGIIRRLRSSSNTSLLPRGELKVTLCKATSAAAAFGRPLFWRSAGRSTPLPGDSVRHGAPRLLPRLNRRTLPARLYLAATFLHVRSASQAGPSRKLIQSMGGLGNFFKIHFRMNGLFERAG